jgi:hypothetical protein
LSGIWKIVGKEDKGGIKEEHENEAKRSNREIYGKIREKMASILCLLCINTCNIQQQAARPNP